MIKKIIIICFLFGVFFSVSTVFASGSLDGSILLAVEENGEAWYVYPNDGLRYYLARPKDALGVMSRLGLGAKHSFIINTDIFPERLSGRILLDVEENGEAYYINPKDLKKYYLARPQNALDVMSELGIGITNSDLEKIKIGDADVRGDDGSDKKIVLDVSFVAQAPFGEWSDNRQQDGCEESSALMAVYWALGKTLTREIALEEIKKSSDYQLEKYGEFRDVSSSDTLDRIINDYLGFKNVYIKEDVSKENIIAELLKGNVLIVPVNGRLLGNPYYTQPGPPRHMLVVKGYDSYKDAFITNDPGTRHGEGYLYNTDRFFYAMRDYNTGFHEDISEINKKIIVVYK